MKLAFTLSNLGAVWPQYIDGIGNRSKVLTMDNEEITIKQSPLSLIQKLLNSEGVDLRLCRKMSTHLTTSKQSLPIAVHDQVFMTFKARHARITGDQVYGYIRLDLVEGIVDVDGRAEIRLINGMRIIGEEKATSAQRHLAEASHFRMHMAQNAEKSRHFLLNQQILRQQMAHQVNFGAPDVSPPSTPAMASHGTLQSGEFRLGESNSGCAVRAGDVTLPCMCIYLRERCPMFQFDGK